MGAGATQKIQGASSSQKSNAFRFRASGRTRIVKSMCGVAMSGWTLVDFPGGLKMHFVVHVDWRAG